MLKKKYEYTELQGFGGSLTNTGITDFNKTRDNYLV